VLNTINQTKPQPVSVIMKSTSYGSKVELKSSCFFLNVVLFMQTIYFFVRIIGKAMVKVVKMQKNERTFLFSNDK
jgi:hypothetical protein